MAKSLQKYQKLIMALVDALLVVVAFYIAWWLRYERQWYHVVDPASYTDFPFYFRVAIIASLFILLTFYWQGVYTLPRGTGFFAEFSRLFTSSAIVTLVMMVGNYMFQPLYHSRLVYGMAGGLILLLTTLAHLLYRVLLAQLRRHGIGIRPILLVGAGEISRTIMRTLLAEPSLGYHVVGFLDDDPQKGERDLGPFTALGPIDNLSRTLVENQVEEVIVTLPWQYHRRIMSVLRQCQHAGVKARVVPDVLQLSLDKVDIEVLRGIPIISIKPASIAGPQFAIKRVMDLLLTSLGLLLALPVMAILALAIKLDSPGPVFFIQKRVGRDGKLFRAYKFRSMIVDAEEMKSELEQFNEADGPLFKIKDDPRRTRVGRFLRRTSLDELPQIFNVLKGEMSLVGPRPALPEEVTAYDSWHRKRLEALPGLTGLWQVSGRSNLGFDEMVMLDIYYVENWSPALDIAILMRTIPKVLIGEGAY
jgi:exopolysaccharide biosynthesis polyprenyl glycosylphosphotransferase